MIIHRQKKDKHYAQDFLMKLEGETDYYKNEKTFTFDFDDTTYKIDFIHNDDLDVCQIRNDYENKEIVIEYRRGCRTIDFLMLIDKEVQSIIDYEIYLKQYRDDDHYKTAQEIIKQYKQDESITDMDYLFALSLYITFEFEQDMLIHSLYNYVKNESFYNVISTLYKSEPCKYVNDLKNALSILQNKPDCFNEDRFKMKLLDYKGLIQKTKDDFEYKIINTFLPLRYNKGEDGQYFAITDVKDPKKGHIKINDIKNEEDK